MAVIGVIAAHLVVFLLLVSITSAAIHHDSRSEDEKFDRENSNSTAISKSEYWNNSKFDGFNSEDFDFEGLEKPNITGNTSVANESSSLLYDSISVSLHARSESWFDDPSSWRITTFLAIWGLLSFVIFCISLCCYLGFVCNRRKKTKRPKICPGGLPNFITLSQIQAATNRFHPSTVMYDFDPEFILYEGHLPYHGRVTIKRFMENKDSPKEFKLWEQGISHNNIVSVRGWCKEKDEFILVYDYFPQTLKELLASKDYNIKRFHTWEARFNVIHSVAMALEYLHDIPMFYNNLTSCRIFIDRDLKVKLGDLSHSVLLTTRTGCDSMTSSPPLLKNDVYNFGVILIEVLTGKAHFHNNESELVDWISDLWGRRILMEAPDVRLAGNYPSDEMERLLKVGLWCVHPNPDERPSISSILQMIEGNRYLSDPPPGRCLSDIQVEPEPLLIKVEPKLMKPKKIEPEFDKDLLKVVNNDQDMPEFLDTLPRTTTTANP